MTPRVVGPTLLLAALSGCTSIWQPPQAQLVSVPVEVTFRRPVTERLELWLHSGIVLVLPGRELTCAVDVRVHAATREQAHAIADQIGIELDEPQHGPTRIRTTAGPDVPLGAASIRYRLEVPRHVPLSIQTDDARVAVRGFDGELVVRTRTGEVDARIAGGRVAVTTTSGRIDLRGSYTAAELTSTDGEIDAILPRAEQGLVHLTATTSSAPIFVEMVEDRRMELAWHTMTGRLKSDFLIEWEAQQQLGPDRELTSVGTVHAEGTAPVEAVLRTDSGPVELRRLPGMVAADGED